MNSSVNVNTPIFNNFNFDISNTTGTNITIIPFKPTFPTPNSDPNFYKTENIYDIKEIIYTKMME